MTKDSTGGTPMPPQTAGLDVGDRYTHFCILQTTTGALLEEGKFPTTPEGVQQWLGTRTRSRVILEAGTHSPWLSRMATACDHEVIVANARRVRLIAEHDAKTDRTDAEFLARLGRIDVQLLSPIVHRGADAQADLAVVRARDALVRTRTLLVNHARGIVKSFGGKLSKCSTKSFARAVAGEVPEPLWPALEAVLLTIDDLSSRISASDRELTRIARDRYPEAVRLMQVPGVGVVTALCYVLTLEDPSRFAHSRAVGAYLGLCPRRRDSGTRAPQLRITKAGDRLLRRLLVQSAHYILGPFGPDTDLRRKGLGIAARGGKNAKKRAVIAVARALAVLLHCLWDTERAYIPIRATTTAPSAPAAEARAA